MKTITLLPSELFPGFASCVEPNICGPPIGNDSKKGPSQIKTVDLAFFNGSDHTLANDGTSNYNISSKQMGKGTIDELPDDFKNRTSAHIKKLNRVLVTRLTTNV